MDAEDNRSNLVSPVTIGQDLSDLSVDELTERLSLLHAEILRIETEILNKRSTKTNADAVFKI